MNIIKHIKPFFTIPDKEVNFTPAQRLAIIGITTAPSLAIHRLSTGGFKGSVPTAIAGFTAGLALPELVNALSKYKQQNNNEKIRETLKDVIMPEEDAGIIAKSLYDEFEKTKRIFSKHASFTNKAINAINKTGLETIKSVGKGLMPVSKSAPIGEKIWGGAIKGSAGIGLGIGTYKGINYIRNSQPYNYTNTLRNNILSGSINPSELNSSELNSVKTLGMK
jgi:hypothetical protein